MSYLFPVPARPLRSLLDCKASTGGEFTEDEATLDLMLMIDRDDIKPERYRAKRWGWSQARVHRKHPEMLAAVGGLREWNVNHRESRVNQTESESGVSDSVLAGSESQVNHAESRVNQYRPELDKTTELDISKPKPSTRPRQRRKDPVDGIDFDAVLRSWNEFATPLFLPTCRSLSDKRRAGVRQRHAAIWPHIDELYEKIRGSPFLLGAGDRGWRASFDFIWTTTDRAQRILEGQYDGNTRKQHANPDSRRPEPVRESQNGGAARRPGKYNALLLGHGSPEPAGGAPGPGGSAAPVSSGAHAPQLRRVV